ncbi:MAG: DNA-directed RNA polymerase subunit beta [Mycoplasmataceae bacterium]|nr:MAG: DNA-directed RNA polymerase subunit beta [Mycoplasmataceae bacterium]
MNYRQIKSGKNPRREYLTANRSPLFEALPERDYAQEQKLSYSKFLNESLSQLFAFYFPAEFKDYNNDVKCDVTNVIWEEPKITEGEAQDESVTWNHSVSFDWKIAWDCHKMQIKLLDDDFAKTINQWIEESFKIGKFTCKKKNLSAKEIENLIIKVRKQLEDSQNRKDEKSYENIVWHLSSKIRALEENRYQEWEIKEVRKSKNEKKLEIDLEILERKEEELLVSFHCEQEQKVDFCQLPKMTSRGDFIINGHKKAVVFQSVRAPKVYYFGDKENGFFGEIIPLKGPWISIAYGAKNPLSIEVKFLNSGLTVDLIEILKSFSVSYETIKSLFSEEDLNISNYEEVKELEVGIGLPQFLFTNTKGNSYFNIGKLGRKKCNKKMNIIEQLRGQVLVDNLYDENKKIILKKNSILEEKSLQILKSAFEKKKIKGLEIPHSTNELYSIKVFSPLNKEKVISVIGIGEDLSEEKTYFDLADLICVASSYINLHHGLGIVEKSEDKDKLENQVIRRVGDLIYNIFDNKLGGFLQDIDNKYLAYISQLNKVDFLKIPTLKDFDNLIKHFFNTSALVQLQNQNNPLAEVSYSLKSSVLGLGGFNSANATFEARSINDSQFGCYDPIETPEGQRIGLIHHLTIGAKINDYGQLLAPYYSVENGLVTPELVYLTSDEVWDKHIAHVDIKIDKENKILDETVMSRHRGNFLRVPKEQVDYIDSSFYQLNSVASASIPFFSHNDASRMLMASGMVKQAVTLLKNEVPLVASGIEQSLAKNCSLTVEAENDGEVIYVDSQKIVIKEKDGKEKTYNLKQLVVSNKNSLVFSFPLVKKGDKVKKGQIIVNDSHTKDEELALGYNLRVAYCCWNGYNYEDAIILNERLVKDDIFTSFYVKKHTIIRHNTKYGPEVFTSSFPNSEKSKFPHLDEEGIVKIGTKVKGNDILVGKLTPEPSLHKESEEELLLMSILGEKAQRLTNTSLRLPAEESGTVYQIKRKNLDKKNDLELVEVYVVQKRKIEIGDKLTTRFGNKGVVAKIVPEIDMPFDEEGKTVDIIFNPLGIPTRMNIGQLLETILASAALKLDSKILCRPFNSPSLETIKEIVREAGIKNYGSQKLFDGRTGLPFDHDVYNGYIYTLKLNHMVADKFHARNTGPRSLIYQQPLKGRSREGGQRIGGMEAWVLEALGAPHNLMEKMSSDDIYKVREMQNHLLFGGAPIDLRSSQNESFNLLLQHLRGIGFDLQATDYQGREIDFYDAFSRKSPK